MFDGIDLKNLDLNKMLNQFQEMAQNAKDDNGLSLYCDDVEITVGKSGIAEKIIQKFNWITGKTSQWWLIQKYGIEKWLWDAGKKGEAIFNENSVAYLDIKSLIDNGPVILGTKKIGGLSGGHIILAIGYDNDGIICNDPFGDAKTNYKNINGEKVYYPDNFLKKYTGEMVNCIYWR